MAIIKITKAGKTKESLKLALNYISNETKTKLPTGKILLTSLNCWGDINNIYETMISTKELYKKATDNKNSEMYKHFQQSFKPNELNPTTAHEIGIKWAQQNFAQAGFEVCICTHIDKEHIHNHFIINSVNSLTGKTLEIHANKTLEILKASSDKLCKQYGLSIIDRTKQYTETNEQQKPINKTLTKHNYSMKKRYSLQRKEFLDLSWQKEFYTIIKAAIESSKGKSFSYFETRLNEKNIVVDYQRLKNDIIFKNRVTGKQISDRILNMKFTNDLVNDVNLPKGYFLRKHIEQVVGKIPEYNLAKEKILSPKKQGFYELIENLIKAINFAREVHTRLEFCIRMEKQGWLLKTTSTGKAYLHQKSSRMIYDNTLYKITGTTEYCLAHIEKRFDTD